MIQNDSNYMTPSCYSRLSSEMEKLLKVERPETLRVISWAAGNGDRSENADYTYAKKRLREIDSRLRFLKKRLHHSVVIDPLEMKSNTIQFSATVTVQNEEDEYKTFSIVGIDELDVKKGWVSWKSPIGRSLLGKKIGDIAKITAPKEKYEFEIIKIEYKEIV